MPCWAARSSTFLSGSSPTSTLDNTSEVTNPSPQPRSSTGGSNTCSRRAATSAARHKPNDGPCNLSNVWKVDASRCNAGYPCAGYPRAGYPRAGYPRAGYPQGVPLPYTGVIGGFVVWSPPAGYPQGVPLPYTDARGGPSRVSCGGRGDVGAMNCAPRLDLPP